MVSADSKAASAIGLRITSGFAFVPQTVPGCALGIGWLSDRLVKQVENMLRLLHPACGQDTQSNRRSIARHWRVAHELNAWLMSDFNDIYRKFHASQIAANVAKLPGLLIWIKTTSLATGFHLLIRVSGVIIWRT